MINTCHPEATCFEVALVIEKCSHENKIDNCVNFLVAELEKAGLIVEHVPGLSNEFLKLAAPLRTLGIAATRLSLKKATYIGMELLFEWDKLAAFTKQPDGSLFSWCERFQCLSYVIYGIVNKSESAIPIWRDTEMFFWQVGESLLKKMQSEGVVKDIFPLHDEFQRKSLLRKWALNWLDFTWQPIDEVYSYYGTKIAVYFSFLGMYTKWLFCPAAFSLILQLVDFGSWHLMVLPVFFVFTISWAIIFFRFWKRKNAALLTRWQVSHSCGQGYNVLDGEEDSYIQPCSGSEPRPLPIRLKEILRNFQRDEWIGCMLRFRNDAIILLGTICLQFPFELAYAHFYEVANSDLIKFGLTAVYLLIIQYYIQICGKISFKLIKHERNKTPESNADSLVYKVFGLYFMQSYIGLFYHILLNRNFGTLRQVLIQRLIIYQVLERLAANSVPYLKYSFKKYKTLHKEYYKKRKLREFNLSSRVEKEFLKPAYCASIGVELEDGLFDDFLELALQFGMIMMFACAFPLAFAFAAVNNVTEIRTDALKLLVILRRPVPRSASTIGAWLNIFQFLIVLSICTNCILLACLYNEEGWWKIDAGLAAILIMEHVLLLVKFIVSHLVPEEPAWVRANRAKNVAQAQDMCSKQLLGLGRPTMLERGHDS